ncbi:MAG: GNAT family N-acetyltransferase [Hydrococcus sp. Prado102]|jgi:ribosomal protein S18 acetylase RimI-like enzyme|nr:GNAT family N-acetyltransferase [Hydrococcus sp. Prado102]
MTVKTIRYATQKDAKLICAMTQAAYAGYRSLLPYSSVWQETPEDVAREMNLGPILLFMRENRIIGSVRCHIKYEKERSHFLYIHRLAVLPNYRRQGIGRTLMEATEEIAKSLILKEIRLEVRAAQPENQEFYLKLGYRVGAISLYLPDGSPRAYWMSKAIV